MKQIEDNFVTFEIAKELSKIGFAEECLGYYTEQFDYNNELCIYGHEDDHSIKRLEAPLWSQTIDWFRNEKKLEINVFKWGVKCYHKEDNPSGECEILALPHYIYDIEKAFDCKGIFIEDLKFKDKTCGNKGLNRHNKNLWKRGKIKQNLQKRCYLNSLTFYEVSPQWSSVIGNLMYPYTDPINASIEIARRGAQVIFEKTKSKRKFYPLFSVDILKDQWKEYFKEFKSWKEIFSEIKNSKLKYRVLPDELNIKVFSLNCKQSLVFYHTCT